MKRLASSLFSLLLVTACSGGGSSTAGTDASTTTILSGSPDAGPFAFSDDAGDDAGPLLSPCNPTGADSCPTGFVCYQQHTSASWWVDLYGTCTFDCNDQTYALCDSLGGVCGCPVPQGATSANCSDDGGVSMVCVPGLKPGTSPGANDGDGGCGTPGCSGGAPVDDAGGTSLTDAAGD
jgi:hypothetical protein